MYTQCPHCLTIFEIDEDALQSSLGIVHCGNCAHRFDALRTLSNTLPADPTTILAELDPLERVPTLTEAVPSAAIDAMVEPASPSVPGMEGEPQPADVYQPPGSSSDWFAELETELTSSLLAGAMGPAADDANSDNSWHVSELPAQASFPDADVAVTFADYATDQAIPAEPPDDHASLGNPLFDEIGPADLSDSPASPGSPIPLHQEATRPAPAPAWPKVLAFETPLAGDPAPPEEPPAEADAESGSATDLVPSKNVFPPDAAALDPAHTPGMDAATLEIDADEPEPAADAIISDPAGPLAPVYVRPRRRRRMAGVLWGLGCVVLALVLAAQLVWSRRAELIRNPATYAWASSACRMLDCALPPIRDPAKLELLSRDVRPDPNAAGALMISATVRNDASFRQPWPVVVVELTDLDNNPVAMRRFRPAEYMPDPSRRAAGIAPGATSAVAFEVADPGKRAVAFQFSFE